MRVKGHTLNQEGRAWLLPECTECEVVLEPTPQPYGGVGGPGHARCSCGIYGPHDISAAWRRKWHRNHKKSAAEKELIDALIAAARGEKA